MRSADLYRVAFLHPDLGLGGAERLVVDAASELVRHGHHVDMFTAYYDPKRCFAETITGGFKVHVAGDWFPRHITHKFYAMCAYIRCILVAIHIIMTCWRSRVSYDVIIVDQVSAVIPILKMFLSSKIIFYCHFPDMLLAQRTSLIKKYYRAPLDWIEQTTTGMAHMLLVNSKYTGRVFAETFTRLDKRGIKPEVLYPAVSIPTTEVLRDAAKSWCSELDPELVEFIKAGPTFLSINRFERKKDLPLAIDALAALHQEDHDCTARLILAGGYDERLLENKEHLAELKTFVNMLGLEEYVRFFPSFTDRQRQLLLAACTAVIYTPQHEHFGIVPLEAMALCRPVIACNSGGPLESIVEGVTGFLCHPTVGSFGTAMQDVLEGETAEKMGMVARAHVKAEFSREMFGDMLHQYVVGLAGRPRLSCGKPKDV